MAGITDFITMAAQKLGVPAEAVRSGTGGLLDLVRSKVGGDLFGQLTKAVPDAGRVAAAPPEPPAASGGLSGMLGGLAQKAGEMLGGSGGAAVGVLGMLQKAGISADKAPGLVRMFLDFLKSKLSPDLLAKVLAKVGDLTKLGG